MKNLKRNILMNCCSRTKEYEFSRDLYLSLHKLISIKGFLKITIIVRKEVQQQKKGVQHQNKRKLTKFRSTTDKPRVVPSVIINKKRESILKTIKRSSTKIDCAIKSIHAPPIEIIQGKVLTPQKEGIGVSEKSSPSPRGFRK